MKRCNLSTLQNKRMALALVNHLSKVNDELPPLRSATHAKPPSNWCFFLLAASVAGLLAHTYL